MALMGSSADALLLDLKEKVMNEEFAKLESRALRLVLITEIAVLLIFLTAGFLISWWVMFIWVAMGVLAVPVHILRHRIGQEIVEDSFQQGYANGWENYRITLEYPERGVVLKPKKTPTPGCGTVLQFPKFVICDQDEENLRRM